MVQRVQVVVEKQEGERAAVLDDDRAAGDLLVRAVLEEGADAQDRERAIGAGEDGERGDPGPGEPGDDGHEAGGVQRPGADDARPAGGGARDEACLGREEGGHADRGAEDDAPGERVVGPQDRTDGTRQAAPDRGVEILALGIVMRVGQPLVAVMVEMLVAEAAIGDGEAEGQEDQRLGRRARAEGVAVHDLVLERGVEREQDGEDRDRREAEGGPAGGGGEPARVGGEDEAERRPLDPADMGVGRGGGRAFGAESRRCRRLRRQGRAAVRQTESGRAVRVLGR